MKLQETGTAPERDAHGAGRAGALSTKTRKPANQSKGLADMESTLQESACEDGRVTVQYLSLQDVADRLGITRSGAAKLQLPEPDVRVGKAHNAPRGWSEETIDAWNANRPGRGNWGSRKVASHGS